MREQYASYLVDDNECDDEVDMFDELDEVDMFDELDEVDMFDELDED